MHYQNLTCEKEDHVCSLVLGPQVSKAIDLQAAAEIEDACRRIRRDDTVRAVLVVIEGASGTDTCLPTSGEAISAGFQVSCPYDVPGIIAAIECPVVTALNGDMWGFALALALAGDLRVASQEATVAVPDVTRACFFPVGITQRLPRIVGQSRALEMLLTGAPVTAAEALRMGLVHRLVSPADVVPHSRKLAAEIASRAPIALRYVKEAIRKGADLTLDQGLRLECDLYMILQTTRDRTEGITAFREKREPFFRGE